MSRTGKTLGRSGAQTPQPCKRLSAHTPEEETEGEGVGEQRRR